MGYCPGKGVEDNRLFLFLGKIKRRKREDIKG